MIIVEKELLKVESLLERPHCNEIRPTTPSVTNVLQTLLLILSKYFVRRPLQPVIFEIQIKKLNNVSVIYL